MINAYLAVTAFVPRNPENGEIHMTTATKTKPVYAKDWQHLALHLVHQAKARYDAYEADVNDWYRNGDGRPTPQGRGHAYPECIHGYSRWTDYDNICGACEDGYGHFDYLRELVIAKELAQDAFKEMSDRIALYTDLDYKTRYRGLPVTYDTQELIAWIQDPVRIDK